MSKSGLKAFFLGLIPGMGHMYMRKFTKGFIYSFIVLTILMIGVFSSIVSGDGMPFFLSVGFALFVWFISMFDLIITILRARDMHSDPMTPHESAPMTHTERASDNVSSATIALSFIPGLGHMHMGLAMRGLTFLVAFF